MINADSTVGLNPLGLNQSTLENISIKVLNSSKVSVMNDIAIITDFIVRVTRT